MGKQIQIEMAEQDERDLLEHLRRSADIRLWRFAAPTAAELEVADFAQAGPDCRQFLIWNTAFAWRPVIGHVAGDAPAAERRGWAVLQGAGRAPLLEYDRAGSQAHARLYWAKLQAPPDGIAYDLAAFERWYESVADWVRAHGERSDGAWRLPHARRGRAWWRRWF